MTMTLYWYHVPVAITAVYLLWAVWPDYQGSRRGDFEVMFGHVIGLFAVAVSWAIAGVFFK